MYNDQPRAVLKRLWIINIIIDFWQIDRTSRTFFGVNFFHIVMRLVVLKVENPVNSYE